MAKNRSGHRPGGGIASRVNVQPKIRTGAGNRGVSVGATGQLGQKQGDHTTALGGGRTSYRGEGPIHQGAALRPAPLGNAKALDVGKGGCGTGRTLYGQAGVQGQHGAAAPGNPPAKSTDILRQFGPDYKR